MKFSQKQRQVMIRLIYYVVHSFVLTFMKIITRKRGLSMDYVILDRSLWFDNENLIFIFRVINIEESIVAKAYALHKLSILFKNLKYKL